MNRQILITVACATAIMLAGCQTHLISGPFIGNTGFKDYTQISDQRVKGRSCRQWVLFVPVGPASVQEAYRDALSKAPEGTTGLANVRIERGSSIPILVFLGGITALIFGTECQYVSGFPARRN